MSAWIDFSDATGKNYRYWFLDTPSIASSIKNEPGNYVFVKKLPNGNFMPLYFGVAESLQTRIPNHERWADAVRAGATHVLSHTTPGGERIQLAEERALIQHWNPVLNTQHKRVS